MKAFDEWRKKNDLYCLYFGGDLRADTLISAWTPISWVANCLNREYGMKFCKSATDDPNHYLRLLAEDRDAYLPQKHELVQLLDRFLELAELKCNYILLPDREMNRARYNCEIKGIGRVRLYDEVPPMLYHIFDKDWFGKYFEQEGTESGAKSVQTVDAVKWVKRERLDVGFRDGIIDQDHVIPLLKNLHPGKGKDLMEDGTIIPLFSKAEYYEVWRELGSAYFEVCTGKYPNYTDVYVREDYKEIFESKRKKGKTFFTILHEMAKEVAGYKD